MLEKMKGHGPWVPVAFAAVLLVSILTAAWDFAHSYTLAGGENPMMILEGRWPTWNGAALAVGLASIGMAIIKAVGGFLLVAVLMNKALSWPKRIGGALIALILVIPTFTWSVRSAVGMAGMAFGDTIAGRQNEKLVTSSIREQIEADQKRLQWMHNQQTTGKDGRVRYSVREARELRAELKENRANLRNAKGVGAADPGGGILANVFGVSEASVSNWTIVLFVATAEIISMLGFPAVALATYMGGTPPQAPVMPKVDLKSLNGSGSRSNGVIRKPESKPQLDAKTFPEIAQASVPPKIDVKLPVVVAPTPEDGLAKLTSTRRGRPRNARLDDGHLEEFADTGADKSPDARAAYRAFCAKRHIRPLSANKMWAALKRKRRLGSAEERRAIRPHFQMLNGVGGHA